MNSSKGKFNVDSLLSTAEAESWIENLKEFYVEDITSQNWLSQHEKLERLNIEAHYYIQMNQHDFITEALLTLDKVPLLIRDLMVIETWKNKVFPAVLKIASSDTISKNSMLLYLVLYHEATVLNLLEVTFENKEACLSGEPWMLDLVDYCSRKLAWLSSWNHEESSEFDISNKDSSHQIKHIMEMEDTKVLKQQKQDLDFTIAIHTLSVIRYITDYLSSFPLNIMTRLLNTNDMTCALVHVMERAPWCRRRKSSSTSLNSAGIHFERFQDHQWIPVLEEDLPKLGKVEGQVWISLYNLLVEPECQRKYDYTEHRKETLLQLKPLLSDVLLDQLPILTGLQRSLEELLLYQPGTGNTGSKVGVLVEEISQLQNSIAKSKDWKKIAQNQVQLLSKVQDSMRLKVAQNFASLYDLNQLEMLLEDPKCAKCGQAAEQRCSRCKHEWYCSRACQVGAWKGHKAICDVLWQATSNQNTSR